MYLRRARRGAVPEPVGLTVIPARASYRHVRELAQESGCEEDPVAAGELAEANVMHLDDPDVEGILALKGGEAVGRAYVLAAGEVGSIEHVYVAGRFRGQGIGRAIVARAIEACARSTFRHVFVSVDPASEISAGMYRRMGFERVGEVVEYRAPL
jgi:ribosomal protein S18 acetylase RimI-like enzyme